MKDLDDERSKDHYDRLMTIPGHLQIDAILDAVFFLLRERDRLSAEVKKLKILAASERKD